MNCQRLLTMLLVGMALSACAQFKPYRTPMPAGSATTGVDCEVPRTLADGSVAKAVFPPCEEAGSDDSDISPALQHRHYTGSFKGEDGSEHPPDKGDYFLSFVEFDDQGWFADRRQMDALFALLKDQKDKNRETLIYVYAHGWKHNASACDNNVVCFSRLLERLDLVEKKLRTDESAQERTVVGVYVGWRGLPFGSAFNNLSFWSRKDTAARVGRGGVFELLTRLNDYRDSRQAGKETDPLRTQLIITGHSFGGLVVYSALSHALMERAARTTPDINGTQYDQAKSFGDFVMLVNPAFEGSLYEPLFHIATNRCYDKKQRPVTMIVTSEADSATRVAFPIGRGLSTILQHAKSPQQRESILKTIGHNPRYVTHDLTDESGSGEQAKVVDDSQCGCPYLEPTAVWNQQSLMNLMGASAAVVLGANDYSGRVPEASDPIKLTSVSGKSTGSPYAANYPYLVVKTDEKLIPNHNAIYNERFTTFTQAFMLWHVLQGIPLPADGVKKQQCPAVEKNDAQPGWGGLLPLELSCVDAKGNACASATERAH